MIGLSRKSVLAIEAVVDIAHHGKGEPVSSRDFTDRLDIPRRHLEPVLQSLVRNGILKSIRGPRGGYVLARERRRISLRDIVQAATSSRDPEFPETSALGRDVIEPMLTDVFAAAETAMDAISLQDLMERAESAGVLPETGSYEDFTI
ncbi:MAG: Rrf2 family transcriptional regulator [Rhodobiaceae bacterium]|nr:Rrf2 family transcriptional regulator [Rhodobiaceae bacterium]MCC0017082.1 Rrf2 family transcriptional regulator [Rhodobiaceae bacterium]